MSYAKQLLDSRPRKSGVDAALLTRTIDSLTDCAQACIADTDDDLGEQNLSDMVTCIRLCLDCADVCLATGKILSRQTAFDLATARAALQACEETCRVCGDECQHHAQHGFAHLLDDGLQSMAHDGDGDGVDGWLQTALSLARPTRRRNSARGQVNWLSTITGAPDFWTKATSRMPSVDRSWSGTTRSGPGAGAVPGAGCG